MISKKPESQRRTLCETTDTAPSLHHQFNLKYALPYIKGKTILDIGCWTGQFEKLVAKHTKSITGIDPNKEAISFAKKHIKNATFVVSTAEKLPFKKNAFDTVTIMDVIEHVPVGEEIQVFEEINRVLKSKGTLVLSTPSRHPISILLDPAYFLIGHRHYSIEGLQKLLSKAGFKIKTHKHVGNVWELLFHNVELLLKHTIKVSVSKPKWLEEKINVGYVSNGFSEVYLVAKKID